MKKITLLLLFFLTTSLLAYSQCTTIDGGAFASLTMVNDGSMELISDENWPNAEYSPVQNLIIGNTYTVTGTNSSSIYITVAEIDWDAPAIGGTILAHGLSSVSFTATTDDIIVHWHLDANCGAESGIATETTIQCTSPSCTCTAGAAPDAPNTPVPADNETDVAIDVSGVNPTINFSWADNGESTNYTYNLIGVGSLTGATNPLALEYSWVYDTTYTWSVTATNCLGEETSSEFSFTTETDPALSVNEFTVNAFSVYPNPTKDIVNIKTNLIIESVEVTNMLGKRVKIVKGNTITSNTINIKELSNGLYFLNINAEGKKQSIKILKE